MGWTRNGTILFIVLSTIVSVNVLRWYVTEPFSEELVRWLIVITAKMSLALLAVTFISGGLHKLLRKNWTRTLFRNRRYTGMAFGFCHLCHFALLVVAVQSFYNGDWFAFAPLPVWIGGGLGYLFVLGMMATSFNFATKALGPNWRKLHLVGSWYLWLIFFQSYVGRVIENPHYIGYIVLLLGMVLIRWMAWRQQKQVIAA